jgi:membrane protein insertase Oxa1/YidC/SpoIIIJ
MLWSSLVDVVRASLFVVAHWCGGSFGAAIFLASVAARLALFPLTVSATRRRLAHERDGVKTPDVRGLLDAFVQLPPAAALYSAIRGAASRAGGFLWIGDLATPDRGLALVAGLVTAVVTWLAIATPAGKTAGPPFAPVIVSAAITFVLLSHFSAGLAIASVANSLMGAAERAVALRTLRTLRTLPAFRA